MGYFVRLNEDNIVEVVISIANDNLGEPTLEFPDTEAAGRAFIANALQLEGTWLQTSYNNNFRGQYAGQGMTYDPTLDEFVSPVVEP